jgi:hypothetical protein
VPLRRFGMLDFDKASEIIAAGRELASEKLAGWQGVPGGGRPAATPEVR